MRYEFSFLMSRPILLIRCGCFISQQVVKDFFPNCATHGLFCLDRKHLLRFFCKDLNFEIILKTNLDFYRPYQVSGAVYHFVLPETYNFSW